MKKSIFLVGVILAVLTSSCNNREKGSFNIGQNTFLLNNEPYVVKAAELHYPRIPREYWEHRIEMTKALGMNTICLYIFWNIHEPEEGKFDFTGNNDVAAFCRLAQKHGMQVIVRPGPYVCAEWEMGGLPWWLLKRSDIKLRDNDPYYLERTRLFMNEVGKQLADLQITRGGNIIMFQVENEYSAYGTNKEYVANIRDIVKEAGLGEVPLFQCDWNSNFENNALDDLLWTINFGTGANIEDQFRRLKELRPESPLMCSEFWSGWFDHWGGQHETSSAEALVAGLKEMLDQDISFSLYMTHGGTSFGHWGGANFPNFSPTTTSYDYDAPINEYGRATPKYYEVRKLLEQYLPEGEQLAPVPDSIPTISISEFELTENAVLFDNLPEPKRSEDIKSMEYFDQGWGSILYRTKLKELAVRQTLVITEAHDWTQVFLNGERIATLSRLKGEGTVVLPPVKEGDVLDILVEAMGRMNFGEGIYDRKGITEKVELISENGTTDLKDWKVYNIPVDYEFAKNRIYKDEANSEGHPAFYRASFTLDEIGDTFLDMSTWSKGMAWVNGHAIGRYWQIGPQQALYVPGCWLKKGENEVIVLDMASPEKASLTGLRAPTLDELSLLGSAYTHRKVGEELNLEREQPYYAGSFKPGNGWQHVKFGKQELIRYFCLKSLNSHGGDDYAAIAELELLGEDGKPISRQHWKVVYADSEETNDANNIASNVFDLQESTFWHTDYSATNPGHPHHIVIDLGEDKVISGFSYLPRPESGKPGMIKDYRIYVKDSPFKLFK
ncbi:beta-galactosidase [Proteiniphilum sp. UBA5384]|uniref:beta-galactosidase n=1 Tax=Proteiniphilum sp. UBA5384 TaxID=1947279 RepID=UPI0025FAF807|nr:beta-galactosidase [Proteiniphilum sp. UBA5384]